MRRATSIRLLMMVLGVGAIGCSVDTSVPIEAPAASQLAVLDVNATLTTPAAEGTDLIPAIAFVQSTTYELVSVPFEGDMPGAFSLTLDPLSPRVITQRIALDGEPAAAVGAIATISQSREAELAGRRELSVGLFSDPTTHTVTATWCLSAGEPCYSEDYGCTAEAAEEMWEGHTNRSPAWQSRELFNVDTRTQLVVTDGCTLLSSEGDPSLREPVESYLAFAQDHWLLHLNTHAPAGSITSYLMGTSEAIPAGYSVIALDRFEETAAQIEARESCEQEARDEAAAQVGSAHRVTLSDADFDLETCTQGISICDEAMTLALRGRADRNCPFAGYVPHPIAEADLSTLELTFSAEHPVFPW